MTKPPAFPLYASDFLTDTSAWTIEEMGAYVRLLFTEWINKELPNDPIQLSRIAGCSPKKFQKVWCKISFKFRVNSSGKLINEKLEKIRQEQIKYRESKSKAGKAGAEARWQS